jgi:hypothetical protein
VTGLLTLLAALAVLAASLLGGCSDNLVTGEGQVPETGAASASAVRGHGQPPVVLTPAQMVQTPDLEQNLASVALDDTTLSDIRGGYDADSGITLNFAFQQATFVNHNLTESIVVPTLTISPGQGTVSSSAGLGSKSSPMQPNVGIGSLGAFGLTGSAPNTGVSVAGISSATVVANGAVQTQVAVSTAVLQALVNSGMASVIGPSGGGASGGISSTIANTANNQTIQQMTTVDIGVSGLSKLVQQTVPASVLSRLVGPNAFR